MIRIMMFSGLLSCAVYICGMDAPQATGVWALDPNIAQRFNVSEWQNKLLLAVIYNQDETLLHLLKSAGDDVKSLVSSHWSNYGSILEAAYIESKEEIKKTILPYINDECLMNCFNRKKQELYGVWQYNASQAELHKKPSNEFILRIKPSAEAIVRDLYLKDPNRFPLTAYECERLDIKK